MTRYETQRRSRAETRENGFVQRFGIVDHLLPEGFSGSCVDICSSSNTNPELRAACDVGSQAYCSTADKIASAECSPYVTRLIRTRAAEKTSTPFADPVLIPPSANTTIANYYNALGDAANQYIAANITTISSASVNGLMKIIQAEGGDMSMFSRVADTAIAGCASSSTLMCETVPWIKSRVDELVVEQVKALQAGSVDAVLTFITTNLKHFLTFEGSYSKLLDLLVSKMVVKDITKKEVIDLRRQSKSFRLAVDVLAINYICDSNLVRVLSNADGDYLVDLSRKPKLYDATVSTFMSALASTPDAASDKLVKAYETATQANIVYCTQVDPLVDPTCVAMRTSGNSFLVSKMDDALAQYCASPSSASRDSCVKYMTALTDPEKKSAALAMSYTAAVNADGTINPSVLDKYGDQMKDWLKEKTADIVTTDASGNIVITASCGNDGNIPVSQCRQICDIYPQVCLEDQIRKAQLPQYRYAKDSFKDKSGSEGFGIGHVTMCSPSVDEMSANTFLYVVLLAIAFAFAIMCFRRRRRSSQNRSSQVNSPTYTTSYPSSADIASV